MSEDQAMLLDLLREIEDRNTKLGSYLECGDTGQARGLQTQIHHLVIEAAVVVLRTHDGGVLRARAPSGGGDGPAGP
jgi:hypothetical protein